MGKKGFFQMLGKFMGKEKGEVVTARPKAETQIMHDLPVVNPNKGKGLFDSEEERAAAIERARQELIEKAKKENSSYDPVTDPEVSLLLQRLSQGDRAGFFKARERSIRDRRDDETMSQRDMDILTLRAMQRSTAYGAVVSHNDTSIRWDSMSVPSEGVTRDLTHPEILLLSKFSGKQAKSIKKFSPAGYFTYDYHLDLNESIKTMFASGLICYADFKTCLEAMTVKELKEILADCDLSVGGKKSILVERITENCDSVVWEKRIDRRVTLTDKGRELVAKYDVLMVCQNNSGIFSIALEEAGTMREQHPDWSAYEIIRFILGDRSKRDLDNRNYGLYRNCLFGISEAYRLEGDREMQKHYLLQCCFMDAIGYANGGSIEERLAILAPGLISRLAHIYAHETTSFGEDYQEALKTLPVPRTSEYEIRAFAAIREALAEQK